MVESSPVLSRSLLMKAILPFPVGIPTSDQTGRFSGAPTSPPRLIQLSLSESQDGLSSGVITPLPQQASIHGQVHKKSL